VAACDHIKKLPDADRAAAMLQELKRHAEPILFARGWRVTRLYEMCCCTAGGKNLSVGGFCVPKGDSITAHRIALRLREPTSHVLYDFDRCMSVLLHELSHIVHGNHSASFYQLMVELNKDHDTFLRRGVVLDAQNMPVVGGRKLDTAQHNLGAADAASAAHLAAVERAKKQRVMGSGRPSGGDAAGPGAGGRGSSSGGGDWRNHRPGEMALRAAAARMQAWDADHGLGGDELEASQAAAEEQEGDDQDHRSGVKGGMGELGAGQPRGDSRSLRAPAPHSDVPGLFTGGRGPGRARWVSLLPCDACGPDCRDAAHKAAPPSPQDLDEGGSTSRAPGSTAREAAAAAGTRQPAVVASGASARPAATTQGSAPASSAAGKHALFVDLTCSDDETEHKDKTVPPSEPPQPAQVRRWDCRACTLSNPPSSERCEACDTWRYARLRTEELAALSATFSTRYFTT
jgi:uncharacterized membrane protein YgcG